MTTNNVDLDGNLINGYLNNMDYVTIKLHSEWNLESFCYSMHSFTFTFHNDEESLYYGTLKDWLFSTI